MILDPEAIDGILVDLDGVVTDTARLHAAAWKRACDEVLAAHAAETGREMEPFDIDRDYRRHVDGKPRQDGLSSFLAARGLDLPPGSPDDPPETMSLGGVSARKNAYFQELLARDGVPLYESSLAFLRRAEAMGLKIAVVSSSKNCGAILKSAGLDDLFETKVDGNDLEALGLPGKPAPDGFLEAAQRLAVAPGRCVVIEDAVAGVVAAKAGRFARVMGIDRGGQGEALRRAGADIVIEDLAEVSLADAELEAEAEVAPNALERFSDFVEEAKARRPVLFLDYDGTLTPIVARPELAVLGADMRAALRDLSKVTAVAIVSGRRREDVEDLVKLPELYYAGSHGFDISGPSGREIQHSVGAGCVASLAQAEREMRERTSGIDGALIEGKTYAVAAHYRLVPAQELTRFHKAVAEVAERHPDLRLTEGKKVLELRPNIDWDKGRAVLWLLDALHLDRRANLPIYIGDDTTDEDAFAALAEHGIGILVSEQPRRTAARYLLRDPEQVCRIIRQLTALLERCSP